jgi:hypothetical protein
MKRLTFLLVIGTFAAGAAPASRLSYGNASSMTSCVGFLPSPCATQSEVNLADPWLIPIASITGNNGSGTVNVTTSIPHGLASGAVVNIAGVYDASQSNAQAKNSDYNTFGNAPGQNLGIGGGVTITVDSTTSFHYRSTVNSGTVSASGQTGYVVIEQPTRVNQVAVDPVFGERFVRATCRELNDATWPANSACGAAGSNPFFGFSGTNAVAWNANANASVSSWGVLCAVGGSCLHPGQYNFYVEAQQQWNGSATLGGGFIVVGSLNPATLQITFYSSSYLGFPSGLGVAGGAPWSTVNPDQLYFPNTTSNVVQRLDLKAQTTTTVFAPASECNMPNLGAKAGIGSQVFISASDTWIEAAYGSVAPNMPEEATGQQYWNYDLLYNTATGTCYWWNTETNQWGSYNSGTNMATGPVSMTDPRTGLAPAQTASPASVTTSAGAGGSLAAGTYYLETTYTQKYNPTTLTFYGESLPSPEKAQALSGSQTLTVTSPPSTPLNDSACGGGSTWSNGCAYDQMVATGYNVYLAASSGGETLVTPLVIGPGVTPIPGTKGSLSGGSYGVKLSYVLNENGSAQEESDGTTPAVCVAGVTGPSGSIAVPEPTHVPTEIGWKIYTAPLASGTCGSNPAYGTFALQSGLGSSGLIAVGAGTQTVALPGTGGAPLSQLNNQTGPVAIGVNWSTPASWTGQASWTGTCNIASLYNPLGQNSCTPPTLATSGFTSHACGMSFAGAYSGCTSAGSMAPDGVAGGANATPTWQADTNNAEMNNQVVGPAGTSPTAGGGHPAPGYSYRDTNVSTSAEPYDFYRQNYLTAAITLLSNPPLPADQPVDMHQSAPRIFPSDTAGFAFDGEKTAGDDWNGSAYSSGWALKPNRAWDNEVVAVSGDGSLRAWRFAKDRGSSFGSILSTAGWVSSVWGVGVLPICNISQDGKYALCQCDWYGTIANIGCNSGVPTTSCMPGDDMFIYELK